MTFTSMMEEAGGSIRVGILQSGPFKSMRKLGQPVAWRLRQLDRTRPVMQFESQRLKKHVHMCMRVPNPRGRMEEKR